MRGPAETISMTHGMTQPAGHIEKVSLKDYLPDRAWPHFKLK